MNFIALFENKKGITYHYTKRGMSASYVPDKVCEEAAAACYDATNGNLFAARPVVFRGNVLLEGGVDLHLCFAESLFADHVALTLTEGTALGSIELFIPEGAGLKKVGECAAPKSGEEISLAVALTCRELVVRLNGCYMDAGIERIEVFAATGLEDALYPTPTSYQPKEGVLALSCLSSISASAEVARGGAAYLMERFAERTDKTLTKTDGQGDILLSVAELPADAYRLTVTAEGVKIEASGVRGFFYAADTLMQLLREGGVQLGEVYDEPMLEMRGVHILLPSRRDIPFLKRLIRETLVPMRYNMVYLQLSGVMRYEKHPEINEKWLEACEKFKKGEWPQPAHYNSLGHDVLEKHEIAELCAYIRSFGMEIVPEVQSLSHVQYITTAYPELAERQKKEKQSVDFYVADDRPEEFYAHDMCPQHPRYYEIIFDIVDEVVELIRPERFLHMGHDEAYGLAKCPICSEIGGAKVYAEEVTRLNEYVRSKGLTMMIWSDMVQNKRYSVPEALEYLPRDVVLLDFTWYFDLDKDIEDKLLAKGHKVLMGNMYSSHYPRYESRIKKPGMVGAQVSTWIWCREENYAFEGKMYDFVYSANMMWSPTYDGTYRRTYNEQIKPIIWAMRERIADLPSGEGNAVALDVAPQNVPADLLWHVPYQGALKISATAPTAEIAVGAKADMLTVVHATDKPAERVMWAKPQKIGEYVLQYEDGTEYACPVRYALDIMKYSHAYATPYKTVLFRHEGYSGTYMAKPICGKDQRGRDYTLFELPLKNPHPEKRIARVLARHMGNTDADILLFEVKTIKS